MDEFELLKRLQDFCATKGEKGLMKVIMRSRSVNPKDILKVMSPAVMSICKSLRQQIRYA